MTCPSKQPRSPGRIASSNAARDRTVASKYRFIDAVKVTCGCIECGYDKCAAALEFDHLPGTVKLGHIATMVRSASWTRLVTEMEKCEVVCANCHRERTVARHKNSKEEVVSRSIYRWQVELLSGDTRLVTYVDEPVKVGNEVTLKDGEDEERLWTVMWVGERVHKSHLNTDGWKVGGLA